MERKKSTKQHLIEESAELFNKAGYAGTSLSDITEAAGLTKGSIYSNFKDKNALAIAAFQHNYEKMRNEVGSKMRDGKNATEKLLEYVNYYRKNAEKLYEMGGCPIINAAVDADDGNDALKSEVQSAFKAWREGIVFSVNQGLKDGEFRTADPKKFAHRMIASIEGGVMMSKVMEDPIILHDVLDKVASDIYRLGKK